MDTFSALSDKNRRAIVSMIAERGEMTATDIARGFKISAPAVSQHLRILREAKLVQMKKDAQRRIYSIEQEGIDQMNDFLSKIKALLDKRFQKLDQLLDEMKHKKGDTK